MKSVFHPDFYVHQYLDIHPNKLKEMGVKVFIVDIDNTLVPSHQKHPDAFAKDWIQQIKDCGITPVIVSNNTANRIAAVSKELNVQAYSFSLKPSRKGYKKVEQQTGCNGKQVAVLGDQLMTDIWGGSRMGYVTILTDPVSKKDNFFGSINRIPERFVFQWLKQKHLFEKGKYYGNL